jgi:Flp pilus assembly protein TadG
MTRKPHAQIRQGRSERGQSLVELALSLVVMLMLLTGAVEMGLALFQYVTMRDAAQEGALYGSIAPDEVEEIKLRAQAAAGDIVALDTGTLTDPASGDIVITYSGSHCEGLDSNSVPNSITVTITFPHPVTMPLIGAWIGSTINLSANVTDTILTPSCP